MNIIHDSVRFIMPTEREYQFPAMAIVQEYVNGYDQKMHLNNVMPEAHQKFVLHYDCVMSDADWDFFQRAGIKLVKDKEPLDSLEMEIDMSIDHAMKFFNSQRHVSQVYGQFCGINISAFPQMRTVAQHPDWKVIILAGSYRGTTGIDIEHCITGEQLLDVKDGELTCVVGYAGWETYLAASMGLYVAEIRRPEVPRNWLSKWVSPFYYQLESTRLNLLPKMLDDMRVNHELRRQHMEEEQEKKLTAVASGCELTLTAE